MAPAAVGRVHRAEAGDGPGIDGPLRHLVGGRPCGLVAQGGDGAAVVLAAPGPAQHAVQLAVVFRHGPGAVRLLPFQAVEEATAAGGRRPGEQAAAETVLPQAQLGEGGRQCADVVDAGRAGGREVPLVRPVGPLAVLDALDQFRDQEVEVGVALAMGMGGHVGRHAHHPGGEVGAVVQVEATQVVLVGLAVAAVLGNDQAGDDFQHLAGAQQRAGGQLFLRHRAFGGAVGVARQAVLGADDSHFAQGGNAAGQRRAGGEDRPGGNEQFRAASR